MAESVAHAIVVVGETTHAAELFAAGLTDDEIAAELGLSLAATQALPELRAARLTPAHAARIERALGAASLRRVAFRDVLTKEGDVVRLEHTLEPDAAAAKVVLPAIDPDRYGQSGKTELRVIVARLGVGSEREAVGVVIEHEKQSLADG